MSLNVCKCKIIYEKVEKKIIFHIIKIIIKYSICLKFALFATLKKVGKVTK